MSKGFCVKAKGMAVFNVPEKSDKTLLQSMEEQGIETHFHCRDGFCGACRTQLISGQVTYINEPLAYVRQGDILPCVCVASSDIEIEH